MTQTPSPHDFILKWRGDMLTVTLTLDRPRKGHAAFRTNLGRAKIRRREIMAETERGETPLARAWTDIPLPEVKPGVFSADIPLNEVGVFSGKACFFPESSHVPEWPEGRNLHVKVESAETRKNNSIYTVFPRQFGSFRAVVRKLDFIMREMGFKIIQTLPPFPVPTTYAVMGEYGCPFAATDFLSVDPAMAEFDEFATPLDQFRELIDAVHAREGLFFVDLPANHTGWASTLQTHHPDWFRRETDGRFHSPGAWGVKWADLVELDYSNSELCAYMADVFLFWCRNGVDGFRCDAGYMIPLKTWEYIVARVREEYPDTVFMLEGLGGDLAVTDALLAEANLDWAYSEIFQTYDRGAFEWYLPQAIQRAEKYGTLVHFAETHDNDRLAKGGKTYARLRVQLAALLSWQGAWGIVNGVEWYCCEKIDVHGKNDLAWGASDNMVALISRLNWILANYPAFSGKSHLELVTRGEGNVLAVVRTTPGTEPVLLLANLDCANGATVEWKCEKFPYKHGVDLVSGIKHELKCHMRLGAGEVLCLEAAENKEFASGSRDRNVASPSTAHPKGDATFLSRVKESPTTSKGDATLFFHWRFPHDLKRDVVVPPHQWIEISSPYGFRLDLVDPREGRTHRACRSERDSLDPNRHVAKFLCPLYKGDGTHCRVFDFRLTSYVPEGTKRSCSRLLVPPPADKAKISLTMDGSQVRKHPDYRTILSDGRGSAAQVRVGWGRIASQYDALLAANPNPDVPSDRLVLWTRTRCWLQREGYSRELDAKCVTRFTADPAGRFAKWDFRVPCGMGKETAFEFVLSLNKEEDSGSRDRNVASPLAQLTVTRIYGGADDVGDQVRLVFRPDIEWRSFHATTKAYAGPEKLFASCVKPVSSNRAVSAAVSNGFDFAPYGETFAFRIENGVYHHEPEWAYNVSHTEESARGQDGSGDLFSPGWISADLKVGDATVLKGCFSGGASSVTRDKNVASPLAVQLKGIANKGDATFLSREENASTTLSVSDAFRQALDLFIVKRDDLKTVLAGYPWFLDWGRDTFIFMRGMIVAGKVEDSLKILHAFAAFESQGTLPNIIYGGKAGNRDTTDAPLWFIRCVEEIESKAKDEVEGLKKTCESIVEHYITGTPNGIHVDEASGHVWSPSHFTWMDTNYPACTPRVGYPVEIQALWISALRYVGKKSLADKALASVKKYFKVSSDQQSATSNQQLSTGYYDCLAAPKGEPASRAKPEDTVRPNQLFLVTLGILDDPSVIDATEKLIVPGGMRSLNAEHKLYCGTYAGDEDTSRKPAYHNGTVWTWVFPLYAEALVATGRASREVALSLLASAVDNANVGCLCHVSENADGDAPHVQKGCTAQAWGDSEFLRVWLKLGAEVCVD